MSRLEILQRIDELYDNNCVGCEFLNTVNEVACRTCPVYIELGKAGDELTADRTTEVERILEKGEDMKFSEILYLLEKGVIRDRIRTAMRIGRERFGKIIKIAESMKNE